ncbi:MAG TPA: TonB-dependent receptor [Vicinamibacterales bacterium]|nr:TonB-dependent receptor [Vicinamibacterales bacterium]
MIRPPLVPSMTRAAAALALAIAAAVAAPPAAAQEARGTITGTVRDSSGAVIPGASVTIANVAMATDVTVVTNEVGLFQAPYLLPGTYRVTAELSGFTKATREVELRIADRLEVDLSLATGTTVETVNVTADTPLLETTNASLGNVVDSRRIAQLPTPHGDPYALIGLAAGVTYTGSARLDRPFEPTHIVGYSMDGTRGNRSDLTIDGVPSTATANAGEVIASYVPPADIVQEFKVQTATFDAASGNTEGGVTNLMIKSGTNALHGTAYIAKTPKSLFANDFFANSNNIPLSDFDYNRYGGMAGGPIVVPGYNGRGKTFFMYGFEGIHESRPRNNGTPTVPTERMRNGDFSELLALGPQYQIYNPFTRRAVGNGRFQQDPFPGNLIPQNLINPVARAALEYFAHPLTAGNPDGTGNFQQPSLPEDITYANNTIRIDHNLTDKQRMYGRVSWYDRNSNYNNYFNNLATGEWFKFISRQVALDHVYVLNASTVMNLRYGYNWFVRGTDSNPANHDFDLTSLGFPASYANAIPDGIRRFPRFDITGYQGTGIGGEERPNETHSFIATINKNIGAHAFRTGIELRQYRETSEFFANNQTGQFNFDSTWTRGPLDNSTAAPGSLGQSFASFLLGLPSSGSVTRAASYDEKSQNWGVYLQDDWRVNARLTINLGLRYEYETPLSEVDNRSVRGFDAAAVQAIEAAARARYALNPTPEVPVSQFNVRGGLTFAGVDGQPTGLYETPKNNVMPRVGLTFKLNDRTIARGGYGMFYGFLGQRRGDVIQSGFSANTNLITSLDNGLTFAATLSNPFPNGIQEPLGSSLGIATFLGQGITFFDPNPKSPRTQRWQIGIQRELPGRWTAEASYVGNYGSQLQTSRNLNATPNQYLSTSPVRDQERISYLSQNVPNPFFGLMPTTAASALQGQNIARERLLRPYPQFDSVNTTTNEGESWYHALQVNVQRRFAGGYTLASSYTYSKFTEAVEFLNAADPEPWKGLSAVDVPHRFTLNGIYELPFGRGRRIGSGTNAFISAVISGWQFSGIYTYQSGFPLAWGNIIFTGNLDDIALPASERTVARWFNVDAGFNKVSAQQLGSNVRTFPLRLENVRSDTVSNVDLSLIKNTSIAGKTLELRLDALNALNHPLLPRGNGTTTGVITTPTSANFGATVSSTQENYARRVQVSVKFLF